MKNLFYPLLLAYSVREAPPVKLTKDFDTNLFYVSESFRRYLRTMMKIHQNL